jgi:hypothetical protein
MAFSFSNEYPVLSDHVSEREPLPVSLVGATPATAANYTTCFIADRPYVVTGVQEIHATAGTDAGAVTLDITKDTGTGAPASGSSVLVSGTFNLKGTANTLQTILAANSGVAQFAVGDRLALKLTGVPTSLASLQVQISIRSIY